MAMFAQCANLSKVFVTAISQSCVNPIHYLPAEKSAKVGGCLTYKLGL